MKTLSALLLLSAVVVASAGIFKGTKSVKVGKKTYKCTFNIAYTGSPPACKKKTVKCKPVLKKYTKFAPISAGDAKITVSVFKNKVTVCKVEAKATEPASTVVPPVVPTVIPPVVPTVIPPVVPTVSPPSEGDDMNCACVLPSLAGPATGRRLDMDQAVTSILLQTREGSDWATARLAAPADTSNGTTYKWVYDKKTRHWGKVPCRPRPPPPTTPSVVPGLTNLLPILALAGLAGLLTALGGQALLTAIIAALGRNLEIEDMEEREREQARILNLISDRQGLLGLLGQGGNGGGPLGNLGNNNGGGLLGNLGNNGGLLGNLGNNGGLLGNLGNNGGLLGNLVNNGGLLGNLGGNNAPSPPPAPAPGGLLGNLLGGGNAPSPAPAPAPAANLLGLLAGGNNGGVGGLLSGGGNGGIQEALMQAALNQMLQNPESLQGVITAAVESGMAEQTVTNMIESGKLEELAQNLLENGAGQQILNNAMPEGGMEALQQSTQENLSQSLAAILNGMEPGSLEALLEGIDMETMEMKMQCRCVRKIPDVVT